MSDHFKKINKHVVCSHYCSALSTSLSLTSAQATIRHFHLNVKTADLQQINKRLFTLTAVSIKGVCLLCSVSVSMSVSLKALDKKNITALHVFCHV